MWEGFLSAEGQVFRFSHALVRHVLYAEVSPPRRARLHHRIAEAIEQPVGVPVTGAMAELAHHLILAGNLSEPARVIACARRAAEEATAAFAWGDAAHFYEACLTTAQSEGITTCVISQTRPPGGPGLLPGHGRWTGD
jgi:predicted ATPase